MTAAVLSFPPAKAPDWGTLMAAANELHALITLDRVEGASPVRIYLVMSPRGKREVAARLGPGEAARAPEIYALVVYDFPFARLQIDLAAHRLTPERANDIVAFSASLQQDALVRAALALGLTAAPAAAFDAEALKAVFFPNTQESVIGVVRLSL